MKFNIFLFVAACIFATSSQGYSQSDAPPERCSTPEYLSQQLKNDPALKNRMDSIESLMQHWIKENKNSRSEKAVITIPVVIHVVYYSSSENISEERIYEQIDALNQDYRNLNPDGANVPVEFQQHRADTRVNFCLAKRDPNNNSTTGIERRQTSESSFPVTINSGVKYYSQGGLDAWDSDKYLNIWVCDLVGNNLGFAQFPGGSSETDGLVIDYEYFGITGTSAPFNMGRTTVHEIGHYFNLHHIWGEVNDCSGTDYCSDTPNQKTNNFYCPSFPLTDDCTSNAPGVMFMNFMDYVDDDCMVMFTNDQAARIQACLNTIRLELKISNGCDPVDIEEIYATKSLRVYPNPASSQIQIEIAGIQTENITVKIMNTTGQVVLKKFLPVFHQKANIDINSLNGGVYFLQVNAKAFNFTEKIIVRNNN